MPARAICSSGEEGGALRSKVRVQKTDSLRLAAAMRTLTGGVGLRCFCQSAHRGGETGCWIVAAFHQRSVAVLKVEINVLGVTLPGV